MFRPCRPTALLVLAALFAGTGAAEAQIWDRARRAVERGAERAVERQVETRSRRATEAAINAMFDAGEGAVRCLFTDRACIERAQAGGDAVVLTDADGAPVDQSGRPVSEDNAADAVVRATGPAVSGADANFDFEPGSRVLFATDFSRDHVGDFPRAFEFMGGNVEVVEWQGRRLLRLNDDGVFAVPLPEVLPGRFTIEFDYHNPNRHTTLRVAPNAAEEAVTALGYPYHLFLITPESAEVGVMAGRSADKPTSSQHNRDFMEHVLPVRIMVDDTYAKMYVGETRVANLPNADFNLTDRVVFHYSGSGGPAYIGDLRIAAGGRDLYGTLEAEGRVVTEGVYFDTGSATLRPESFGVVQEIAEMLRAHPDLRVRIEGHTDNVGDPASNQTLSEDRANAVRAMLVGLGIDAGRLEAAGHGQARPVASNDSAEGRAQNRRVELVRL